MPYSFTPEQLSTATQVVQEANKKGATPAELLALMEAGLVESGMRNLSYGDRDSAGVFQERPSQGWHDVMNIPIATDQILAHMNTNLASDPGAMAQSAERSAYPARYNQMAPQAAALLVQIGPGLGASAAASGLGSTTPGTAQDTGLTSNPVTGFTNWVNSIAVKVGLSLLGAGMMLIGVWIALGHPVSSIPAVGNHLANKVIGGD